MTYDPRYGQPYGQQPDSAWPAPGPVGPPGQPVSGFPVSGFPGADPVSAMPASPAGYPPGGYPVSGGPPPPYGTPQKQVVPRPPRPMIVFVATVLTLIGAAVSFADVFLNYFMVTEVRDSVRKMSEQAGDSAAEMQEITDFFNTVGGATAIILGVVYVLAAAGVITCAVLALRGSNAARITQVVLVGVYAVSVFCCRGYSVAQFWAFDSILADPNYQVDGKPPFELPMGLLWASTALNVLLCLLSVAIFALLLLPQANRYFSPGTGKQFAKS